jgi:hypothetical protein
VAGFVLQETFSVIGDPATAMRDPMFYRWHAFVDDVFQEHKATLSRYDTNKVNIRDPSTFCDPCSTTCSSDIRKIGDPNPHAVFFLFLSKFSG